MKTIMPLLIQKKNCQALSVAVVCILLSACNATPDSSEYEPAQGITSIAVVGAVAKSGLKAQINVSRMSIDLAALLAGTGQLNVTPTLVVRDTIGGGPHDEMLAQYARNGRLAAHQIQRLMAANIPASGALFVRLESDRIDMLPVVRQRVFDSSGELDEARERRVYSTRRTTALSATLLDLQNGRVVLTKLFKVSPETVNAANHHTGESFGSSLAAVVADTMVHGLDEQHHPSPPALSSSILALLQEVAYAVPAN